MDLKKAGCKKAGSLLLKKRKGSLAPSLFDPVFLHSILDLIFSGSQTDPSFQNKNNGCTLIGWMTALFTEFE